MLQLLEGSQAVAETVARCRPQVVCAYPISPQTHIIEAIGAKVKAGTLAPCEFINVESEFAAMSVAIGASAAGARAYTATASQGLLFMAEAVYNAAGLGLPIVMTLANRAIGAPINIWNDHSDAMALRDAGWIQLFAADNQEACDMHVLAFRLAEELSLPVMVCMDGFILTHAFEPVDLLSPDLVDAYLSPVRPRVLLDPDDPVSVGAMVGPEAFAEVRYLAHLRHGDALAAIPWLSAKLSGLTGRSNAGLVEGYRLEGAHTVVVTMGSLLGTLCDAVDARRDLGEPVGALGIKTFRPFPQEAVNDALSSAHRVVVVEKAFSTGLGGVLATDVHLALHGALVDLHSVIAGLGGRPVSQASLEALMVDAAAGHLPELTFLDLNTAAVSAERAQLEVFA